MRDPHKLKAFEHADKLVCEVYAITKRFPRDERFGLTHQLRRAAVSIASNIVEGCARKTHLDYSRFMEIAYGSAAETRYQLDLAGRLGFIDPVVLRPVLSHADETCRVLNGLVESLSKTTDARKQA